MALENSEMCIIFVLFLKNPELFVISKQNPEKSRIFASKIHCLNFSCFTSQRDPRSIVHVWLINRVLADIPRKTLLCSM